MKNNAKNVNNRSENEPKSQYRTPKGKIDTNTGNTDHTGNPDHIENMGNIEKIHNSENVSKISIIYVLIVFFVKSLSVISTNSIAFFAEFMDSVLDFFIVFITWISLKKANKKPDFKHMFGHYKINSFGGLIEALISILIYGIIAYNSLTTIFTISEYKVQKISDGIVSLIIVIILNLIVSTYLYKVGKESKNATVLAQLANFRGDLYRNLSVVIGLSFVNFGFYFLDPIIAFTFSVFAIIGSWNVLKYAFHELTDYNALEMNRIEDLKAQILSIRGIKRINAFSIRTMGNILDLDLKISLGSKETIYSLTNINSKISDLIKRNFPEYISNTIIQVESQESLYNNQNIINIIKDIGDHNNKCESIHGIILDILQDEVLIQFHVNVNAELTLYNAHLCVSDLENAILAEIKHFFPDKKISIISHIESSGVIERIHKHENQTQLNQKYIAMIKVELDKISQIKDYHHLNLLHEKDGIYITIHIKLDGKLKIKRVHDICEYLEAQIRFSIPDVQRCVIHPEPI